MKHISTGAVFVGASMFLFFIFAASFLAGECAAAGEEQKDDHRVHGNTGVGVEKKVDHHVVLPQQQEKPNQPEAVNSSAAADAAATALNDLKKENEKFIKLLYEPLQKEECEWKPYRYSSHQFSEEKQSLCDTMGMLNLSVPQLKTAHAELNEREIAQLSEIIRVAIHEDVRQLSNKYYKMLGKKLGNHHTLGYEITEKVDNIAYEELFLEFKRSYNAFVKEETNVANVFELLQIGQQMAGMFTKSEAWEQQTLAYQQFAINLKIHSIHIGQTVSKDGQIHDIRAIAEKWTVDLAKFAGAAAAIVQNLIDLKKENKKFIELLFLPLHKECSANRSGYESLCDTVKSLKRYVPNLQTKPNEPESDSEVIRILIHSDVEKLVNKYDELLDDKLKKEILKMVNVIDHKDLISKYKESYVEFMKEAKKEFAKKDAAKGGEANAVERIKSYEEVVYELLFIGQRVAKMLEKSEEGKQQTLAYQQFAINLTIHSINSGHAKHKIRAIAEKWPMNLENLIGSNHHAHGISTTVGKNENTDKIKENYIYHSSRFNAAPVGFLWKEDTDKLKEYYNHDALIPRRQGMSMSNPPQTVNSSATASKNVNSSAAVSKSGQLLKLISDSSASTQSSAAAHQNYEHLKEENENFFKLLYEPLLEECDPDLFGEEFSEEKKDLCGTVGRLNSCVSDLREQEKLAADRNEIAELSKKIRYMIHSDMGQLELKYHREIVDDTLCNEIINKVDKIAPEGLFEEFKKSYDAFMEEVGKNAAEKDANKGGETNAVERQRHQEIVYKYLYTGRIVAVERQSHHEIAYKLLLIGKKVAEMFKTSEAEKQQALAYQQFAINLTIHSILIGHTTSKDGVKMYSILTGHTTHDIRAIAEKWPVQLGKLADSAAVIIQKLEDFKKENEKFTEWIYMPLLDVCKTKRGVVFTEEKKCLCKTVQLLKKFVPELTTKPSKTESNLKEIRKVINSDVEKLWEKYYGLLDEELREKIVINVTNIAPDELISIYKASYDSFIAANRGGDTKAVELKSHRENVYELLSIGLKVAVMFKTSEEGKQQALAYQQFAINLTIHSILIGIPVTTDHKTPDIRAIAQKWPVHLENLVP